MPYDELPKLIDDLADRGELVRVRAEVDARFELAEITRRLRHERPDGGPALLFEQVAGSSMPVLANLLGSAARMQRVLGTEDFDVVAERVFGLVTPEVPENWLEAVKLVPRVSQLTSIPPRTVRSGVSQQVVKLGRDVDLGELPIPHCWPTDAAPAITDGRVLSRHPTTGVRDVDRFPVALRDRASLWLGWDVHRNVHRSFEHHRERGERMSLAVVLGGDPILGLVARAPLPPETDGLLVAGLIRQRGLDVVPGRTVDLEIPAHAEIVVEGYVDTHVDPEPVGPLATGTGFSGTAQPCPVLHVLAVTHRANPVFPVVVPTAPPTADRWLDHAVERLLVPFVRLAVPELVDLHFPPAGVFRNLLFVSIDKRFPGQARKVMNAVWSLSPLVHAKIVVVVDRDVDVHDPEAVWFHAGANIHPGRDVAFWDGPTAMDDHAAPIRGLGRRMGVDGTAKMPEEGHERTWPGPLRTTDEVRESVASRWSEYGIE